MGFAGLLYLALGLTVGAIRGLIGIGGGVVITPALIYWFKFSQHEAQGATLALLVPPIGLLGAWTYYQRGHVDVRAALLICAGFVLGGLLRAMFAVNFSDLLLRCIFGVALLVIAMRMIVSR